MIEVQNLRKSYGRNEVLKGINLSVRRGEITAVLGPNASGKTTFLKCILSLVVPDEGSVKVMGEDIGGGYEYRKFIGYMPQNPSFPENLTPEEVLRLISDIRGDQPAEEIERLKKIFKIDRFMDRPIRSLSGGTRQKVSALVALSYNPPILILDEPTVGLDPVSSARFKEEILSIKDSKVILITSHIMSEVEELADRVVLLIEGSVRIDSSVEEIKRDTGERTLEKALAKLLEDSLD